MSLIVTLETSWADLFGSKAENIDAATRRTRWATWLRLARKAGARDAATYWATGYEDCHSCEHRRGGWCDLQQLPCTVNPILTVRHSVLGMACMGLGYQASNRRPKNHDGIGKVVL